MAGDEGYDFFIPEQVEQNIQNCFSFSDGDMLRKFIGNKVEQIIDSYHVSDENGQELRRKRCWDLCDIQAFYIICVNRILDEQKCKSALPDMEAWQQRAVTFDSQGPAFKKMFDQWGPLLFHCFIKSDDASFERWMKVYVQLLSTPEKNLVSRFFDVTLHGDASGQLPADVVGGLQEIATLAASFGASKYVNKAEKRLLHVQKLFEKSCLP